MKFLLDTHALLWYTLGAPQLSRKAESLILNAGNDIYVSPASYWEIAIKISIGKLTVEQPLEKFLDTCEQQYGFQLLAISAAHAVAVSELAFPKNHRDPFDRLLVAQAIVEQMQIIGSDTALDAYPVTRIW